MEIPGDGVDLMSGDLLVAVGNTQLPRDLMMLIVSRLLVESVLRFKSVCRAWCALFSSPMFIQHHSRTTSSSAKLNNLLSLFVHINNYRWGNPIFFLLVDRSCGERTSILLNPPFECDLKAIQVVGSINGLVCLNFFSDPTFIVLWNPATRKHRRIPNPQLLLASEEVGCLRFAYDYKTHSYKVIRILYHSTLHQLMRTLEEGFVGTRIEIYSTGTNTWITKDVDFPCLLLYEMTCGTVSSGSPYWLPFEYQKNGSGNQMLMMWFDPSLDGFGFYPLPVIHPFSEDFEDYEHINLTHLSAIGELPVAFCDSFRMGTDPTVTFLDI